MCTAVVKVSVVDAFCDANYTILCVNLGALLYVTASIREVKNEENNWNSGTVCCGNG